MKTRLKANLAVAISVGGSIITLPYTEVSTVVSVLHHGFLAATIGGLADWFAIKAIFGKPLGISFRTDILRKNRKRIMQALVDFSSNDLLRTENIMATLAREDFSQLLLDYLQRRGGLDKLKELTRVSLQITLQLIDTNALACRLAPCLQHGFRTLDVTGCFNVGLKQLNTYEVRKNLLEQIFCLCENVIKNSQVQALLGKYITEILQTYEAGGFGRSFMLSSMGLTTDKVLAKLNERIIQWLSENKNHNSAVYRRLDQGLESFLISLVNNEDVAMQLQAWKNEWLSDLDFAGYLQINLDKLIQENKTLWEDNLCDTLADCVQEFSDSPEQKKSFQNKVYQWLEKNIQEHEELIPQIMQEQLARFSDDEIVQLAENKVEDDLQMIRINGAIIGALAGMVLYTISCVVLRGLEM